MFEGLATPPTAAATTATATAGTSTTAADVTGSASVPAVERARRSGCSIGSIASIAGTGTNLTPTCTVPPTRRSGSIHVAPIDIGAIDVAAIDVAAIDVTAIDVTAIDVAPIDVGAIHISTVDITAVDVAPIDVASAGRCDRTPSRTASPAAHGRQPLPRIGVAVRARPAGLEYES